VQPRRDPEIAGVHKRPQGRSVWLGRFAPQKLNESPFKDPFLSFSSATALALAEAAGNGDRPETAGFVGVGRMGSGAHAAEGPGAVVEAWVPRRSWLREGTQRPPKPGRRAETLACRFAS